MRHAPTSEDVRVAAIQMRSVDDVTANLDRAHALLGEAAASGCRLAVLPENFAFVGVDDRDKIAHAEREGNGPIQDFLAGAAREYAMCIVAGSLPLAAPDPERCFGACMVFDAEGTRQACYRKIHLFDVELPDRPEHYRESASMYPGEEPVTVDTPIGRLGLSICYDVRFPELYRRLVDDGATAFAVPAAFTAATGAAHWHVLLRARAIENLAHLIAPGQQGRHPNGRSTFGHSLIVDPWGRVLAEQAAGEGAVIADIDPALAQHLRRQFPALGHRRLGQA